MKRLVVVALTLLSSVSLSSAQNSRGPERLVKEVRHELVMLPYYNVFDNLVYKVDGSTVTLMDAEVGRGARGKEHRGSGEGNQ